MRPRIVLGTVVVALVAGLGTADATAGRPHPPTSRVTSGSVTTIRQSTVVCPDVRGGPDHQVTWVRAQGTGDGVTAGQPAITATTLTNKDKDFAPVAATLGLTPYGVGFGGRVGKSSRAIAFTGTGPSAVGMTAVQVTRATTGLSRGIAAARCVQPGTEFTFVGGSTVLGNQLKLVLTNTDDAVAVVDLTVYGPGGAITTPGTSGGLEVAPHTRRSVDLVKLVPGITALTTVVTAVTGRVAAAELTSRREGDIPRGIDWIPDAGQASRRMLVPGMLQADGKKTLVLANPGSVAANVAVQVVSDTGTFTPAGLETISVAADSVHSVDVTRALGSRPGALLVTADQPVLAGASQEVGSTSSPDTDVTWSGVTSPLTGKAALPTVPIGQADGRDVFLYLSAVHGPGAVTITATGPIDPTKGSDLPAPVHVQVPAGSTSVADLATLFGTTSTNLAVTVEVDQGSGAVTASAAVVEQGKDGLMAGQVGLQAVAGVIELPAVREDPTVSGARPGDVLASTAP